MDEEIVPYEEALELEKLGCNMHCWGSCYYEFNDRGKTYMLLQTPDDMDTKDGVNAPTFSQAFRWFREKYFIHHEIGRDYDTWDYELYDFKSGNKHIPTGLKAFETYEEAELACLNKLIEIVKGGEQ